MFLKTLKISGFKSFKETMELHLPQNLTVVVGPNGCGKSNVLDAIRWTIGESSAKKLRGGESNDVLFAGSTTQSSVNRASVELIFDHSQQRLTGPFAHVSEIAIRREYVRDQGSKYWLNGKRCRRRDVADLLSQTGLGPRSYALIEQGSIAQLIDSDPKVLRGFMEQLAGIGIYKERKLETLSKLERTQENLIQLQLVRHQKADELKRLSEESAIAETYHRYVTRSVTLQQAWIAGQAQQIHHQRKTQEAEVAQLQTSTAKLQVDVQDGEQDLAQQQAQLQAQQQRLQTYQQQLHEQEKRLQQWQHEQQLASLKQSQWQQQMDQAEQQQQSLNREKIILDDQQQPLFQAEIDAKQRYQTALSDFSAKEQTYQQAQQKAQSAQDENQRLEKQWVSVKHQLAMAEQQQQHQQQLTQQLQQQQRHWQDHLNQAQHALDTTSRSDAEQQLQRMNQRLDEQEKQVTQLSDTLQRQQDTQRQTQQQLQAIEQQKKQHQQHIQHSQQLLQRLKHSDIQPEQLAALDRQGIMAQWLDIQWQVPDQTVPGLTLAIIQRAFERGLSHWVTAICVQGDELSQSQPLHDLLRQSQQQIWLINHELNHEIHHETSHGKPAFDSDRIFPLSDWLVQPHPWFHQVGLVVGLSVAIEHQPHLDLGQWLLCLEPQPSPDQDDVIDVYVLDNCRVITPVQANARVSAQSSLSLYQLEDELAAEHIALDQAVVQAQAIQSDLHTQKHDIQQQQTALTTAQTQLKQQQTACQAQQQTVQNLQLKHRRAEQDRQHAQQQLDDVNAQLSRQQTEKNETVTLTIEQCRTELEQLQTQRQQQQCLVEETKNQRQTLQQAFERCRSLQFNTQADWQKAKQQWTQWQTQQQQWQRQAEQNEAHIQRLQTEQRQLQDSEAFAQQLSDGQTERERLQMALNHTQKQMQQQQQQVNDKQQRLQHNQQHLNKQNQQLERLSLSVENLQNQWQQLHDELSEKEWTLAQCEQTQRELNQPLELNWLKDELKQVKAAIKKLGNINMNAIEQFKELNQQFGGLEQDCQDLEQAVATLKQTIESIDRESIDLLTDTFHKVNGYYQDNFPKMFGGGAGTLQWDQPDNLLESGIRVMAQPPGKPNSRLNWLSGGEKTLTALALVFGFFQLVPAPFCVMDEVDAPLDDVNVARFVAWLEEMQSQVQFLVISHNKTTMQAASVLAGVTMHEKGVSRLVSVDLHQAQALTQDR